MSSERLWAQLPVGACTAIGTLPPPAAPEAPALRPCPAISRYAARKLMKEGVHLVKGVVKEVGRSVRVGTAASLPSLQLRGLAAVQRGQMPRSS